MSTPPPKISIGKIKGNFVYSENQSGGVTANDINSDNKKEKSGLLKKVILWVGAIASVTAVLTYFGINYNNKVNSTAIKRDTITNNLDKKDTIKKIIQKTNHQPKNIMFTSKKNNSKQQPITIGDVSGDLVISNNQTGGITAHTVVLNKPLSRDIEKNTQELLNTLKAFPKAAYRLEYYVSDAESAKIASQIDNLLIQAGWYKADPIMRLGGPQFPSGIEIFFLENNREPFVSLSNGLYRALHEKGVAGNILLDVDDVFKVHGWNRPTNIPADVPATVIVIGPNSEN